MNPMYSGHNTFEQPTNQIAPRPKPKIKFADRKGGFPHSEISGSKGARASPELIAACHVLHRLSMPRHPSEALMRLIVLSKTHAWGRAAAGRYEGPDRRPHMRFVFAQTMMSSRIRPESAHGGAGQTLQFTMSDLPPPAGGRRRKLVIPRSLLRDAPNDGGARRDRTDDLMLAKHALYQLSYGPFQEPARAGELSSIVVRPRCHTKCGRPRQTRTADLTLIRRVL